MHQPTLISTLTAVLAALPAAQAGLYSKNSPVLQLDGRSYDKLITKSNYTSIVEFYAPWCGHCKNLQPAYEKVAKNLDGLAKVAAVDCDNDANKPLCGSLGVQGFPTLKIVRPSKKAGGKPVVEDYQGQRTASAIVDAVVSKINNHVARVSDKDADAFFAKDGPKALLFTEKGTTSALLRSIAIEYLDVISVGQVRNKDTAVVEKFGIDKFPSFLLVPAEGEPIVYDGELNKKDMVEFLKQAGEPNPDPAPAKSKTDKKSTKKDKTEKAKEEKKEKVPEAEAEPEAKNEEPASEAPAPERPIIPIKTLATENQLLESCLAPKSQTCVLALVKDFTSEESVDTVAYLSRLSTKYTHGGRHLFPFYAVSPTNEGAESLRKSLELSSGVEIIAVNGRRGWWRRYVGDLTIESIESWLDAMRMGEGSKLKLPEGVIVEAAEPSAETAELEDKEEVKEEVKEEATEEATEQATEAEAEERKHEEL